MLKEFVDLIASASLVASGVQIYLIVTKLWSRKHEKAVAESQSLASNLLGLCSSSPWILKYALDREIVQMVVGLMWFSLTLFCTIIGLGFWVPASEKKSVWARVKSALRLERQEAGELIRALLRPHNAELIVQILRQLAAIDRQISPHERQLIEECARVWKVPSPFGEGASEGPAGAEGQLALRESVLEYLAATPPLAQVVQLRELLAVLVAADGEVSPPEAIALGEISAMLDAHVRETGAKPTHQVLVVPQNSEQESALRSLVRGAECVPFRGGSAYLAGQFFSDKYAHLIRDRYQALGFFTVAEGASG